MRTDNHTSQQSPTSLKAWGEPHEMDFVNGVGFSGGDGTVAITSTPVQTHNSQRVYIHLVAVGLCEGSSTSVCEMHKDLRRHVDTFVAKMLSKSKNGRVLSSLEQLSVFPAAPFQTSTATACADRAYATELRRAWQLGLHPAIKSLVLSESPIAINPTGAWLSEGKAEQLPQIVIDIARDDHPVLGAVYERLFTGVRTPYQLDSSARDGRARVVITFDRSRIDARASLKTNLERVVSELEEQLTAVGTRAVLSMRDGGPIILRVLRRTG